MLIGAASTAELTRNLQALSVAIPPAVWPEFVPLDLPS
jgi:aryl-alcohol dehydrogenase-like predicted oxidoreductase